MQQKLFEILDGVKGTGTFHTSGKKPFIHPGLHIEGVGDIGLPLSKEQAKTIIKAAHKAPFGKGSQTVLDTRVRSAWEIDGSKLQFKNQSWAAFLGEVVATVKEALCPADEHQVKASLYKLLLYEEGDFFLPHKDSEKEKGMFGTLVVGLPSTHQGGELLVRFEGTEKVIDFAKAGDFEIPYGAFFADCEHEIRPVTSGYRLCLTFNLVQKGKAAKPFFSSNTTEIADLTALFLKNKAVFEDGHLRAVLLGHQYTPTNFSLDALKLNDRPRVLALLEAAENAGLFAKLSLVTLHQSGELEYDSRRSSKSRRRRYYDDYDDDDDMTENGTMGEVYDTSLCIEAWAEDKLPSLGLVYFDKEEHVWTNKVLGEGDPIDKVAEGFTGNAGMTMEYWYHYGAVALWSKSSHGLLLSKRSIDVQLAWLSYLAKQSEKKLAPWKPDIRTVLKLMPDSSQDDYDLKIADFGLAASALVALKEKDLVISSFGWLADRFHQVGTEAWLALFDTFEAETFYPTIKIALKKGNAKTFSHLMKLLVSSSTEKKHQHFVEKQLIKLPKRLEATDFAEDVEEKHSFKVNEKKAGHMQDMLRDLLILAPFYDKKKELCQELIQQLTKNMRRLYVNEVLCHTLLNTGYPDSKVAKTLRDICITDLEARVANKPVPPPDETREVPKKIDAKSPIWKNILIPFLKSPNQKTYDYKAAEAERLVVMREISYSKVDIACETIKTNRPYTLRLKKVALTYDRLLQEWTIDEALLGKLKG